MREVCTYVRRLPLFDSSGLFFSKIRKKEQNNSITLINSNEKQDQERSKEKSLSFVFVVVAAVLLKWNGKEKIDEIGKEKKKRKNGKIRAWAAVGGFQTEEPTLLWDANSVKERKGKRNEFSVTEQQQHNSRATERLWQRRERTGERKRNMQ